MTYKIPATQPDLPVELVDHILSFLQEDPKTLSVCMSVNILFCRLAQKHFCRILRLQNIPKYHPDGPEPPQILKLLTGSPHLTTYVRTVRILFSLLSLLQRISHFPTYESHMASILQMLVNVKEVNMGWKRPNVMPWKTLPSTFRSAFCVFLRRQSITSLGIDYLSGFPLSILNDCASLRSLSLIGGFSFSSDGAKSQNNSRAQLERFNLNSIMENSSSSVTAWFESPGSPDLSTVTFLCAKTSFLEDHHHITRLLQMTRSLNVLELEFGREICTYYNPFAADAATAHIPLPVNLLLASLTKLRHLKISAVFSSTTDFFVSSDGETAHEQTVYRHPVSWIVRLLAPLGEHKHLEQIDFHFGLEMTPHVVRNHVPWKDLSTVLLSIQGLKKVRMAYIPIKRPLSQKKELIEVFNSDEHLSRLVKAGLLEISQL
ncbi:hypothetical protein CPC08DRAFT_815625 [Agrocybe pediades]|nr:hypothetical protein CPC08DRAFT_815625 [Agrocybe pediades]